MPILPKLPAILAKALGGAGMTVAAVLIKRTPGSRVPGSESAGTQPSETEYPCRGFVAVRVDAPQPGTSTTAGTRSVILMGATLPAGIQPMPSDRIVIDGTRYAVVSVDRDPAQATWSCQARGL